MKYFLIQSLGSSIFLISIIYRFFFFYLINLILFLRIAIKLGIVPFHRWFISLFKYINIYSLFILSTIQKIIPLIIISSFNYINFLIFFIFINSIFIIININRIIILTNILAYSRINNLTWMLLCLYENYVLSIFFIIIYIIIILGIFLCYYNSEIIYKIELKFLSYWNKIYIIFIFLSLGGIPPLLGFLRKIICIKYLINITNIFLFFLIIIRTLIILIMYIFFSISVILLSPAYYIYINNKNYYLFKSIYSVTILILSYIIYIYF